MDKEYCMITAIVKKGFYEAAMSAARSAGARGGTVLNARGTGTAETTHFLGVAIEPEKEILLILTETSQRDEIMKAINRAVGLNTPGNGIAIALPVEDVAGLTAVPPPEEEGEEEQ